MQVLPFKVFSTNKVDSGSKAAVGSMMELFIYFMYFYMILVKRLPSKSKTSGFNANAIANETLCISPPDK